MIAQIDPAALAAIVIEPVQGEAGFIPMPPPFLRKIRELCNAAHGYELLVNYTPGSLQGTTIRAGDDEVVLNGSGQAVLSRADGPRIRERTVSVTPGPAGLNADSLEFSVIAA